MGEPKLHPHLGPHRHFLSTTTLTGRQGRGVESFFFLAVPWVCGSIQARDATCMTAATQTTAVKTPDH